VVLNKTRGTKLSIDSFFHYLHHRYFECNYGNPTLPFDRWFGTFHDGSEAAHAAMRRKRRMPAESKGLV
jgi:sterol desaturase/sphingolipid hydroxylase (fatty acid hydroxylase superfamily)